MEENARKSGIVETKGAPLVAMNEQCEVQAREGEKKPDETRNMAEALVLSIIQNSDKHVRHHQMNEKEIEGLDNNLREILAFVRDNNVGEESMLFYLICDLFEMVKDQRKYMYRTHSITNWAREVKNRMLKFGVQTRTEDAREGEIDEEDAVGLEEEVELLLGKMLPDWEEGLSTWLITGMAGIGKTTLARQLYKHVAVIDRFESRAWVSFSNELSHREVLIKIMKQVVDSEEVEGESLPGKVSNRELQRMLCRRLEGRPYFIVIDGFPGEMHFECILRALPREVNGSRLLLTSCSQNLVKRTFENACNIHVVKALDSNKSWQLFLETIFGGNKFASEHKFPKHLEKRGREMLAKCGGAPSAIKEVGKEMAEKRREGIEWEQLLESMDFGATTTLKSLESSYQKLYPQLKIFFLHLAFFKENENIRTKKFIPILAAGGVASKSSLDEANMNIQRLVDESMIQANDYPRGTFCMNSLLHRLSIKKAEERIGFEILSNNGKNRTSKTPRHRVITCSREKFAYSTNKDKHLVSLFFHGGGYLDTNPSYWESLEQLRILDFEDFGLQVLLEAIGTLMELRYLGLRNNHIKGLPHSLGFLKKLEVLDIAQNFMVEVPDIIWKMDSLRHLYMSDVICQKPLKIDALQNLETLTYITLDDWMYESLSLQKMSKLKKLGIEELDGNSQVSKLFRMLSKLKGLDYLMLRGFLFKRMACLDELGLLRRITKLKLDGLLARLPSASSIPPKLTHLRLVNSCLDEDPMPLLEKLPKLISLKLRNAYTGQQMVILHKGFPKLKFLCIEESWNLKNVQVGEGAMPKLCRLEINNCPCLETLPSEIGSMDSLKELKMVTSKKVATKIQKSGFISKIRTVDINL